jgi:hypothetical protein
MTGRCGVGNVRKGRGDAVELRLALQPGESLVLQACRNQQVTGRAWGSWESAGQPSDLTGAWQVRFISGGPELPPSFQTTRLASWTELGGEEAQRFAGTALYTLTFDAPGAEVGRWFIDLGTVCQSARVRLNGRELGTVFIPPFRVAADEIKPKGNLLEVEVTNVSANRIRDLDRRKVAWRNFHDINFVNINYKPFDASAWPLAKSGLLGPVRLFPVGKAN